MEYVSFLSQLDLCVLLRIYIDRIYKNKFNFDYSSILQIFKKCLTKIYEGVNKEENQQLTCRDFFTNRMDNYLQMCDKDKMNI